MKKILFLTLLTLSSAPSLRANPELKAALDKSYGSQLSSNLLLLKGKSTDLEPLQWTAYARDAFRPQEILRIALQQTDGLWSTKADGAGTKVLNPAPPRTMDLASVQVRSSEARSTAARAAALSQTTFTTVDYQLAANAQTGSPEWGLALLDSTGYEVGFCVVSAETGALLYQDWTPKSAANAKPASKGEQAAKSVKKTARKAWNWTDKARSETKNFFRELFRRD